MFHIETISRGFRRGPRKHTCPIKRRNPLSVRLFTQSVVFFIVIGTLIVTYINNEVVFDEYKESV